MFLSNSFLLLTLSSASANKSGIFFSQNEGLSLSMVPLKTRSGSQYQKHTCSFSLTRQLEVNVLASFCHCGLRTGTGGKRGNLCKSVTPDSAISRSAMDFSQFHLLISKMKIIALLWKVAAKISDNVPKSLGQGLQAVMKAYLFLTAVKPDLIYKLCSCFFTPAVSRLTFLG